MNRTRLLIISIILIACGAMGVAQTPRRRSGPAAPKPAPSPTPVPVSQTQQPTDPPPATLAIVNDNSITQSDVADQINATILNDPDLYLRAFYLDPEKEIKEARQRALEARINSLLIAAEARKRSKSPDEIVEKEIDAKTTPPTEQEIQAAYEANRAQLGATDLEKVRPDLINYLRSQRRQEVYEAYLNRLRMTNAVARRADVNTPNLAPGTVLAAVNGDPIRVDMINERMKAYAYKLQMRIYLVQKSAVDRRINDLLLIAEANKRKIGPEEIVRAEVTDKVKPPTEAEVVNFYNENKPTSRISIPRTRRASPAPWLPPGRPLRIICSNSSRRNSKPRFLKGCAPEPGCRCSCRNP